MNLPYKGKLTVEYWCSCGLCGSQKSLGASRHGAAAAVQQGWKRTRLSGWVCPGCIKKAKP